MNKKKKTHIKIKKLNLIVALDILFLIGCCFFFGFRLVYYYRIEHPKIAKNESLFTVVTLKKNITEVGSGLYKTKTGYYYKGNKINNYVKYSGRIWRVVSVDKNKNVKLITDESQTSLVWGIDTTYANSYVRNWLNDDNNSSIKTFYESLNNTSILTTTKTCTNVVTEKSIKCDEYVSDKVGLLSAYEYDRAGGSDSYLNINQYWWTSNINNENVAWYVYSKGSLNDTSYSGNIYYSYGVRPTITIKGETEVASGDGTSSNPYNLDGATTNTLNSKYVGSYLKYSGYLWRIIDVDNDYVKIVMNGVIKEDGKDYYTSYGTSNYLSADSGIGKYLNTTFYNTLDNRDYILQHSFYTGRYDSTNSYDYNKIAEYSETMKVGLLQLGELFVTDIPKYFLATRTKTTDNNIYEVLEDGRIYAGELKDELRIRPAIYLKPDLTVLSGSGTKSDPYLLG